MNNAIPINYFITFLQIFVKVNYYSFSFTLTSNTTFSLTNNHLLHQQFVNLYLVIKALPKNPNIAKME